MFSGIVEECATVVGIVREQENLHLTLKCSFVDELKIDQSVSHNGVCLTVVSIQDGTYTVTAMKETIERSNLGLLQPGDAVNVERSMMMNGRLDGHIVQGHVDQTATCMKVEDAEGSWYYTFKYAFDKNVNTVFIPQEIIFPLYTYSEIEAILGDRVKAGFFPGVLSDDILEQISMYTLENGDLRVGINLLRSCGNIAEADASREITQEHLDKAIDSIVSVNIMDFNIAPGISVA